MAVKFAMILFACIVSTLMEKVVGQEDDEDQFKGMSRVLNNLIEMDTQLFEELIASKEESKVRNDETWLIFFDSPSCRRCPEVYDVFIDLSNV